MPRKELKHYFQWFFEVLPERIVQLGHVVRQCAGFADWTPSRAPASLDPLGHWFATQVETRPRTREEIQGIAGRCAYPIDIPAVDLSNRTFSLSMDVGMYVSQVFTANHPSLRWEQPLGGKRFVDYGQPVLVVFEYGPLNPVRMVVSLAYALADKTRSGTGLRELYDIWSEKVKA